VLEWFSRGDTTDSVPMFEALLLKFGFYFLFGHTHVDLPLVFPPTEVRSRVRPERLDQS
jgi:hypothetical protein